MLTWSRQARRWARGDYLGWEDDQGRHYDANLADGGEHSPTFAGSCLASGGGPQMQNNTRVYRGKAGQCFG